MQLNYIPLLTWFTALGVYIGSIRFVVLGRLAANPAPTNAGSLKTFLKFLVPIDIAIVIGAAAVFLHIFWSELFGGAAPAALLPVASWAAFIALIALIGHHIYSWCRSMF